MTSKTDSQIQHHVLDELTWDTRIKEAGIGVSVSRGVVTLAGTVESWAARTAAQEAAHRVAGVLDVANDIRVDLPADHRRSDADIAHAARQALEWDVLVPHQRIRTTVSGGIVTLEGKVDTFSQHEDAARCVRNLAGVLAVNNAIEIEPTVPAVSSDIVQASIEDALERHAERSAKHIRVRVSGGTVILTGDVPSWGERTAVEGAVRGTRGVHEVDNQLRIQA